MGNVLISGGNGLVGRRLSEMLVDKGYRVIILSRNPDRSSIYQNYFWDPDRNLIDSKAITEADYIVHLAGENLGEKRWSTRRKKQIIDSRVKTGELLFNKAKETDGRLKAFISASAIGYYGSVTSERIFTESDPPAADFAAEVCRLWEKEALKFADAGVRTVIIRTGIVLSAKGGALEKLVLVARFGVGSPIGSGNQYLPWIHIEDLCNIYVKAIEENTMSGIYNAVAPESNTNRDFTKLIASMLHRPYIAPPVPEFVMKLLYGEMASMLLEGSRVSPDKLKQSGFNFMFPDLRNALADLLKKN